MFGPSCVVVHFVARGWNRAAQKPWRAVIEQALAPVAIGMTFASGLALVRGADNAPLAYALTAGSTLAFAFTSVSPILLLAVGAGVLLLAGG
jgi:chromate transporter